MLGQERVNYPQNHIEADNRLSWILGRIDKQYGDSALYVHLKRNKTGTAKSFSRRYEDGIIKAYRDGILKCAAGKSDCMSVSLDYCDTVNSNIKFFLQGKSKKITINLENIEKNFTEFWYMIDAQGAIGAALAEFKKNIMQQVKGVNQKRRKEEISSKESPVREED